MFLRAPPLPGFRSLVRQAAWLCPPGPARVHFSQCLTSQSSCGPGPDSPTPSTASILSKAYPVSCFICYFLNSRVSAQFFGIFIFLLLTTVLSPLIFDSSCFHILSYWLQPVLASDSAPGRFFLCLCLQATQHFQAVTFPSLLDASVADSLLTATDSLTNRFLSLLDTQCLST